MREPTRPSDSSFLAIDGASSPAPRPVHLAVRENFRAASRSRPAPQRAIRMAALATLGCVVGLGGTMVAIGLVQANDRVDMYETVRSESGRGFWRTARPQPLPPAAYTAHGYAPVRAPVQQPLGTLNSQGLLQLPTVNFNPFHPTGDGRQAARRSGPPRATTAALYDGGMAPETVSGSSAEARTICVRLCDGYQYPIATLRDGADVRGHEALCRAMFPGVPTRVYRVAPGAVTIDDAVGPDGRTYRQLPMAYAFKTSLDPACARPRRGETTISLYRDFTLRPGDSVVMNGKVQVFTGAGSYPYTQASFRDFRSTRAVSAETRRSIDRQVGVSQKERLEREVRAVSRIREANATDPSRAVDVVRGGPLAERGQVRVIDIANHR